MKTGKVERERRSTRNMRRRKRGNRIKDIDIRRRSGKNEDE